mmetsp:Transcript_31189/g.47758  ORF Transcript_31189/g.47758 Transcript_31189/m.47758 type:complete len:111 (-) Transcript_31189:1623-1955(-)
MDEEEELKAEDLQVGLPSRRQPRPKPTLQLETPTQELVETTHNEYVDTPADNFVETTNMVETTNVIETEEYKETPSALPRSLDDPIVVEEKRALKDHLRANKQSRHDIRS